MPCWPLNRPTRLSTGCDAETLAEGGGWGAQALRPWGRGALKADLRRSPDKLFVPDPVRLVRLLAGTARAVGLLAIEDLPCYGCGNVSPCETLPSLYSQVW